MILSNSKTALRSLRNVNFKDPNSILINQNLEIANLAEHQGHVLQLQWISGNSGILGNTKAGKLATLANTANLV